MLNPHKATLRDAYERLAAREAGVPEPELEAEKERMLAESESPEVAKRYRFERLYRIPEYATAFKERVLLMLLVFAVVGGGLTLLAWMLGGFND